MIHMIPALSIGFSVLFTMMDPVPQGLWASYHVFGLLSWGHGLCTAVLTLTAAACVRTWPRCDSMINSVNCRLTPRLWIRRLKAPPSCTTCPSAWRWPQLAAQVRAISAEQDPTWLQFKGVTPAGVCSAFFTVRGGLWLISRLSVTELDRNSPAVPRWHLIRRILGFHVVSVTPSARNIKPLGTKGKLKAT